MCICATVCFGPDWKRGGKQANVGGQKPGQKSETNTAEQMVVVVEAKSPNQLLDYYFFFFF